MTSTVHETQNSVLATLLSGETFWPSEPHSLEETGLSEAFVEALVCKHLHTAGSGAGRSIAEALCLPFGVVEPILGRLRSRKWVVHVGAALLNDYRYALTEVGQQQAQVFQQSCAYAGPAPVPLMDYVISVEAQAIGAETIRREDLEDACHDISITREMLDLIGPAVNSGAGMFLYGAPGNGKTTLAKRVTSCFGSEIWIPRAIVDNGQLLRLFDAAYHEAVEQTESDAVRQHAHDRRWIRIRRPTVVVGGELTMESLEIRHDPRSNVSEAPLQMKSNCGCLLIDDFGRQRISPEELLNRWIVPLENQHDFLSFPTGHKIEVPFEQLIVFSTNLDPSDLVDEAFLRRIPYKIEVPDPEEREFHQLCELAAEQLGFEYRSEAVEYLLGEYYRRAGRAMRRCHPRDILQQVRNYCAYEGRPLEMRAEYFDHVARSCFTTLAARPVRFGTADAGGGNR